MSRALLAAIVLATLTACGVDGPPTRPEPKQPPIGASVSGDARFGVVSKL